ncbi:hypothetical protein N7493_000940 [Penicillium malachiteum]|uniref:Major facilitator superfamily (MFS) profile domain-containing protein n=1 Tax=Penicillium malachiteum TaxID=1324776 RepID=A0AAD6HX97_9EURO|nr:hypothetical protein N7493_000940 [Penicillium malachiteum]
MEKKRPLEQQEAPLHMESVQSQNALNEKYDTKLPTVADDALRAAAEEHDISLLNAVKKYPKACLWSMAVSLTIIMDGYDTALIGSLFGFPAFQKKFGYEIGDSNTYQLNSSWQVALGLATSVGSVFGAIINAYLTDKFGLKKVFLGSLVLLCGLIFIQFYAENMPTLFVGQLLCGLPWGGFSIMAPAYASEVAPLVLRGHLEVWVVTCWGLGQMFAYAVLYSLNTNNSEWAYRIPFAVQWVWPVVIICITFFAPESPWWLVRKGRYADAERCVMRLISSKNIDDAKKDARETVALMIETNRMEEEAKSGTAYQECFKGSDLWRTEISCCVWGIQSLAGFAIQNYAVYFFEQAGLSSSNAYKMTLGQSGLHLCFNLVSVAVSARWGRRTIYLYGLVVMTLLMFTIGFLSIPKQTVGLGFATSAIYLLWFCGYSVSIGPIAYIVLGETSSTRLRSKTIGLARSSFLVLAIANSVAAPYILNPTQGNWKGKSGFLAGGLSTLCVIWVFFRLPETKGRTYRELDILFSERGVTARNFNQFVVEFDGENGTVATRVEKGVETQTSVNPEVFQECEMK